MIGLGGNRMGKMLAGLVLFLVMSGTALFVGGNIGNQKQPDRIDIRGTITSVAKAPKTAPSSSGHPEDPNASVSSKDGVSAEPNPEGKIVSIMVEGPTTENQPYDKASVSLREHTKIYKKQGAELTRAAIEELTVGSEVEIAFDGPVAESYPVQALAGKLVILNKR